MIWRDVYIEVHPGETALRRCLASALKLKDGQVCIVAALNEKPPPDAYEAIAEVRPFGGDYRSMVTIFFTGDESIAECLDEFDVAQALADGLGCAVLLPAEDDPNPSNFIRFRPHLEPDRVSVDPNDEDEGIIQVTPTPPDYLPPGA